MMDECACNSMHSLFKRYVDVDVDVDGAVGRWRGGSRLRAHWIDDEQESREKSIKSIKSIKRLNVIERVWTNNKRRIPHAQTRRDRAREEQQQQTTG